MKLAPYAVFGLMAQLTATVGLQTLAGMGMYVVTVNMTGTAVYQGAATAFLAQVFAVDLGPAALGLVVVTAVAASIGSPPLPASAW